MESVNFHHDLALLDWQVELGATEAICDAPVNRYEVPAAVEKPKKAVAAGVQRGIVAPVEVDAVAEAERAAQAAQFLPELQEALSRFELCDLKKGARNLVFSDGIAGARVMIVGEAPGRDEDRAGKPFVGRAGQLLDRMFGAIDMGRANADAPVYITNVLPWRPPQNRDPKPEEIAMMRPFLLRHIALAKPEVLVAVGNHACQALLNKRGITRLRGQWAEAAGLPVIPMFHPAYLLRNTDAKREAWADLLSLKGRLKG
ncbi:uracil-DNA glycosylase [Sulfitobacter mediterraneus]|uniref:Type-4 uracil-DNA glycosylase n=1 Tax=Sulfitobacter mediterraneus TaxID=83219 RepID=A0A061SKM9_9RHOB|nr:uracil-DNA glycosylase [Sulfitobacter mediterraneus]KAJ02236.1 uracil-DNA glycosylase [Sulfitobacter mediterraneus]